MTGAAFPAPVTVKVSVEHAPTDVVVVLAAETSAAPGSAMINV